MRCELEEENKSMWKWIVFLILFTTFYFTEFWTLQENNYSSLGRQTTKIFLCWFIKGVKSSYSFEENEGLIPSTHTNSSQPITLQFQCIQYLCVPLSGSIRNSNLIEGQNKVSLHAMEVETARTKLQKPNFHSLKIICRKSGMCKDSCYRRWHQTN